MNSYPPVLMTQAIARQYYGGIGLPLLKRILARFGIRPVECGSNRLLYLTTDLDKAAYNMRANADATAGPGADSLDPAQEALAAMRRSREEKAR